ncbi:glycosyl transferase family 2 [Micromonospora pisi]|uniref:Glycosyl transferase family 2 n=1 Tax=Micromonospora pisi TaxID=589240 RepID=A0A495JGP6_9ACTN|nr:glycosyltransferase [Micromonospora pisi]RKR88053.1 glycosyl transferase family 2 [Micromonospora pisi]
MTGIDILMITYDRPEYVRLSLPHLLASCPPDARVWLWHNGTDQPTLDAVEELRDHPRVHRFHHSPVNAGLREPTNWLWQEATGDLLSKVDDDCLPDPGWLHTLRQAQDDVPEFGVIGTWRFPDEDVDDELVAAKLADYPNGHRLMRNHWVQGSGYLLKREMVRQVGPLTEQDTFTTWCLRGARLGWINGWYHPFLPEDHMDDPRSPHTIYLTDEDFMARRPLSAKRTGVTTVAEWTEQMRHSARVVQAASLDLREYQGWRRRRRTVTRRIRLALTGRAPW